MFVQYAPDLAASLRLQSQTTTLRAELDRAAQELTTGRTADILAATDGDLAPIFGIDARLSGLAQQEQDLGLAQTRASVAQAALGVVQDAAGELGLRLMDAVSTGDLVSTPAFIAEARPVLDSIIAAFNTQFAGRSLFGGAAEFGPPLAGAEVLMADINAIVAGSADAASALAAVDAYFDTPGGGFETNIYLGSDIDAAGAPLSSGTRTTYLVRADTQEAREAMKSVALVAAVDAAGFAGNAAERDAFLTGAAGQMIAARDAVTSLRATIGTSERQIAQAQDRANAEISGLEIARINLLGVDQFTAASRFSDLEGQLQALYVVTSRISNLSLTNFLR